MAPRKLKVCYIQPEGGTIDAAPRVSGDEVASRERVDNTRVQPITGRSAHRASAAIEKLKLWDNGKHVRCLFLDGDASVKSKVVEIAKEWEQVSNLTLDFVTSGSAEVRISFQEKGFSWSTVGVDALTVPRTKATMNYGWLEPGTALREYQRVVRHEFGHALGMIHEHQNPDARTKIPWDKPKVYAYYAQQGWSKDDVDFNIFAVYAEDATNFTSFDPTSIMEYAIPDSLTVGSYSIGWNTELSATDRDFMARQYPIGSPGTVELEVDGPRQEADLAVGAEVDTYHFAVTQAATHIMTTEGPTDVVLTLHGPNDAGAVLAWDDNLGKAQNARIVRKLSPGDYWLSVRHKEPGGSGVYDIGVKRRKG
jgi:Astacin (Peptidase family M12A)